MITKESLEWAQKMHFSTMVGRDTIIAAYAAHLRILAKIAGREKSCK